MTMACDKVGASYPIRVARSNSPRWRTPHDQRIEPRLRKVAGLCCMYVASGEGLYLSVPPHIPFRLMCGQSSYEGCVVDKDSRPEAKDGCCQLRETRKGRTLRQTQTSSFPNGGFVPDEFDWDIDRCPMG
jgi:hypothetical protein